MKPLKPGALWSLFMLLCVAHPGAAAQDATTVSGLFASSYAEESAGNYDRSLNDVLKVLRQNPNHYVANLRVGWLYYLKGRYTDAIGFYGRAQALQPEALEPALCLMLPLMASGQWARACEIGQRLQVEAPSNYLVGIRLAYIYFSQGNFAGAHAQYRSVLSLYPSDTDAMLGLGWTLVRMGRSAEARVLFESVLEIRGDSTDAVAGLEAVQSGLIAPGGLSLASWSGRKGVRR